MRRYQKWLSVGLLALTPSLTLAGPLNSGVPNGTIGSSPANPAKPAKPAKGASNQEIANTIAAALRKAKLSGFDIEIKVESGVATLDGIVASPEQRAAAQKAAKVPGIIRVNNRLGVGEAAPKQSAAPRSMGRSQPIQRVGYQGGVEVPDAAPQAGAPAVMGQAGSAPAAIPAYGPPGSGGTHMMYNQPNFPNYAWPTYAQYPNYAAVTYPSQYAASAWPYIGPFYPYPQVPLGWRKAQLEWDDGYWNLNFRARTDRWWWFLDPRNW